MRRALIAALGAAFLWAGVGTATETYYSGKTSMTFQNGVAPTVGYAGIADATIDADSATTNYGTNNFIRAGGASAGAPGQCSTVISADLSALPDSAIILRARLYLYQASQVALANAPMLKVYRLYNTFTESQVTYNIRKTATNWVSPGAGTPGPAATDLAWVQISTDTAVGGTNFVGADTLTASTAADTPKMPIVSAKPKSGAGAATAVKCKGWATFDITNYVRQANNGTAATCQFLIVADEDAYGVTGVIWWYASNFANKPYRPKIVVEFFDPTSGSSGSAGRRVAGAFPLGVQ